MSMANFQPTWGSFGSNLGEKPLFLMWNSGQMFKKLYNKILWHWKSVKEIYVVLRTSKVSNLETCPGQVCSVFSCLKAEDAYNLFYLTLIYLRWKKRIQRVCVMPYDEARGGKVIANQSVTICGNRFCYKACHQLLSMSSLALITNEIMGPSVDYFISGKALCVVKGWPQTLITCELLCIIIECDTATNP